MTDVVLGIDLGTTNSVVAVADEQGVRVLADGDGEPLIPSVVSFHPSGDILVGRAARDRRLLDARHTVYSVKRLIGRPFRSEEVRRARERFPFDLADGANGGVVVAARGETYTLSEISAFVLRQVRMVAEQALGRSCARAVVTVPANFNELQRSATKAAGRVAGLDVLRILNEPTAAALAYGYGRGSRERIAIFDLGGGTFDVTILELAGEVFEVLATAGDTYLGGDDIDQLIADQMAAAFLAHHRYDPRQDRQAFERLRAAAEWAKCQLSSETEVQLRVEELAYGNDGMSLDLTFGLTRATLEQLVQPLLARSFDTCEEAMRVAGIRPTQLDNVILVGGSTRMPLVARMVEDYFGRRPLSDIDPDLVVAQGAAIQARALATARARQSIGRISVSHGSMRSSDPASAPSFDPDPLDGPTEPHQAVSGDEAPTMVRRSPYASEPPQDDDQYDDLDDDGASDDDEITVMADRSAVLAATALAIGDGRRPDASPSASAPRAPLGRAPAPTGPPAPSTAPPPPPPPPLVRARSAPPPVRPRSAPPVAPPPVAAVPPPRKVGDPSTSRRDPTMLGFGAQGPAPAPAPAPVLAPPASAPPPAPAVRPPLLLDVTPLSLGVETVEGYCEHIIRRNAAIPVEQTRVFATARDDQVEVVLHICQGESRRMEENQLLGELVLSHLPPGTRGSVQIEVGFAIDADGTLGVTARDSSTGRAQTVRIRLIGAADDAEIEAMRRRHAERFGGAP